jgi:aldehyde dehydrogenase (NAD+)
MSVLTPLHLREHLYVDGAWAPASSDGVLDVVNPATEEVAGRIALGTPADVDRAVAAAGAPLPAWGPGARGVL